MSNTLTDLPAGTVRGTLGATHGRTPATGGQLALSAVLDLETIAKAHELPVLVVVGLPETGETIRMVGGIHGANLLAMTKVVGNLLVEIGRQAKPAENPPPTAPEKECT